MLAAILSVESLEDNEVLIVEGVRHVSRINDPRNRATFEGLPRPNVVSKWSSSFISTLFGLCLTCSRFGYNTLFDTSQVTVCCIDPEDYSRLPLSQFEEDNILREMNKSLLGFRQRRVPNSPTDPVKSELDPDGAVSSRRLSPIGESFSSTPPETEGEDKALSMSKEGAAKIRPNVIKRREKLLSILFFVSGKSKLNEQSKYDILTEVRTRPNGKSVRPPSPHKMCKDASCTNRRSRFIVLGSSGEVLPVTRKSLGQMSVYSSCNSQSTDSFHSAKDIIDEDPGRRHSRQFYKLF